MDRNNVWLDHKNESSKTVEQCSPHFCNISAYTNPAYYSVPHHYGSPEFPSYHNYLAKPCYGNMNSCYNHGHAMGDGNPFLCAQPCNAAMERNNCSKMQPQGVHAKGCSMRSNRNKKLNSEKNKNHFSRAPPFINYINTENNNQQMIFDTRANSYNAMPESHLLLTADVGNRNNVLLNESSATEKNLQYSSLGTNQINLQHSSASGNQINSSTNFNMNDALLMAASGTNTYGFDYDPAAGIYFKEENITNFANEDSSASNQFNDFDAVLTKSIPDTDSMHPLNQAQPLDTSKENFLLNATNIFNAGTNQTNLQHSSASGNQTNSSTNFNMNDALLTAVSGTNTYGFNFDPAASIYFQEKNITNFANEDSSASNQFNDLDDLLTNFIPGDDSMQPLDHSQLLDAAKESSLLNAQKTTNLEIHNVDANGKEQIFTLATLCEGKDESGKEVILLLAAPDVQKQIAQGNGSVDRSVETQSVQSAENTSTRARAIENTVVGNENNLQSVQNNAVENFQAVENMNDGSNATFTSNIDEHFGHEEVVKTSRRKKRKHQTASTNVQTQSKKFNARNSVAETTGLESSSQRNLDERHSCQPRYRRANSNSEQSWKDSFNWNNQSYRTLQNQYFWKFSTKYFEENHINDTAQQKDMRAMLQKVGGSAMQSIWCFFETWKTNYYNARRHN